MIAQLLRRGGNAIYLRHGRTRYGLVELERTNRRNGTLALIDCTIQRQLPADRRGELAVAGRQFRAAGVPLDLRWSSRCCQTIKSANFVDVAQPTELLFGKGEVGHNPDNKDRTRRVFNQQPGAGKNSFYTAHGGIFWEATGFTIQKGHTVVLDPSNLGVIVARIAPVQSGQWRNSWRASPCCGHAYPHRLSRKILHEKTLVFLNALHLIAACARNIGMICVFRQIFLCFGVSRVVFGHCEQLRAP